MENQEELKELREALIDLILSINAVVPLEEHDQVSIVYLLKTREMMRAFSNWARTKILPNNGFAANKYEIVRAAAKINKVFSEKEEKQ